MYISVSTQRKNPLDMKFSLIFSVTTCSGSFEGFILMCPSNLKEGAKKIFVY